MKICVAQTKPVRGDIPGNINRHKIFIDEAVGRGAGVVIFPELSLTGYEPELAKTLATHQDDSRLDDFQKISDTRQVTLGVGIPTQNKQGTCISMILFQPHKARQTYSKKYLHPDEEAFFVSGQNFTDLQIDNTRLALAICYELSVSEHPENAFKSGAEIYIASVAKFANGIDKALATLSGIAKKYDMTVLMSNCVGLSGGQACAGQTSVWNQQGLLAGQLNGTDEGILMIDTHTREIMIEHLTIA